MSEKPRFEEYTKWLTEERKVTIPRVYSQYYDSVTTKLKAELEKSEFWNQLLEDIRNDHYEYLMIKKYPLLTNPESKLDILTKPFSSFYQKTYRINVLDNKNFPEEPNGGWLLPENWFYKIKDIVRTQITVKYLDGVEFIGNKISDFCKPWDHDCIIDFEARQEGYYAAHLSIRKTFEIPKITWDTDKIDSFIEIQITTQVQELIKKLLHKYYEGKRMQFEKQEKWQWDYKSEEFGVNYLGHILHYVEGMIMEIRDKQTEKEQEL